MTEKKQNTADQMYCCTIGKIAMEKLDSILSKMHDNTATEEDRQLGLLLKEIAALAKNRMAVAANEAEFSKGNPVWVERTQAHFPHIRLHGGALEDDTII